MNKQGPARSEKTVRAGKPCRGCVERKTRLTCVRIRLALKERRKFQSALERRSQLDRDESVVESRDEVSGCAGVIGCVIAASCTVPVYSCLFSRQTSRNFGSRLRRSNCGFQVEKIALPGRKTESITIDSGLLSCSND